MKIKVHFFDKFVLKSYLEIFSAISVITTLAVIFFAIPKEYQIRFFIVFIAILIAIYLFLWIHANRLKYTDITINNSKIIMKVGDIFQEEGLKIIAFNEYFDTLLDEKIISSQSLNGIFIKNYVKNIEALNKDICENIHLQSRKSENNKKRPQGNTQKYKLGSIHQYGDYLLTAFTRFDEDNRAFLTTIDYINCLLNFWKEVDIIYANRSVVIPLLGTGITRVKDYEIMSEQEKLELLLWTFKVSRIKFTSPAKITIVIHESLQDKISFYKLRAL